MLDELRIWWQNTTLEIHAPLEDIGLVLALFLAGQFLGAMAARALRARNFDAALRLPGASPLQTNHGFTPTLVAGFSVRFFPLLQSGTDFPRLFS